MTFFLAVNDSEATAEDVVIEVPHASADYLATVRPLDEGWRYMEVPGADWRAVADDDGTMIPLAPATPDIASLRHDKWRAIKAEGERRVLLGAPTPKGRVQIDARSQDVIGNLALAATRALMAGETWSITFTMADDSNVTHSAAEMIAMAEAAMAQVYAIHAREQALRAAVRAAADEAALDAIDITAGWPSWQQSS